MPQPVARDTETLVKVVTPGGLVLTMATDNLPEPVRESIRTCDDHVAATAMCNLTGCHVTVERKQLTSVKP